MAIPSKLVVILHADVIGSTMLVRMDEQLAHPRIQAAFRRLAETTAVYGGTAHEVRGDALVAEFARASDAVLAALAFQAANSEHNRMLGDDIRPEIRIGIALGEVVIADHTVTGAGVVLAQRIESLAESGGVCISAAVHEALPGRLPVETVGLGEHSLKGFDDPVRVHSVKLRAGEELPGADSKQASDPNSGRSPVPVAGVPDKPSIAVLPFRNLSGDPEQEYFADGMAEDIIAGLSRFRSLFVIARNSSFAYKGSSTDVREIAADLGIRYVLEGSVRQSGARIRITVQLVDAETGKHLWAERYDRELQDVFDVQDEVTEAIVAAIAPEISDVERDRAKRKPPDTLDAWGLYQRGLSAYNSSTVDGLLAAIEQFDEVNETDPTFAPAFAMGASARWRYALHFQPADRDGYLREALNKAYAAVELDPRDPTGLWNAGSIHSMLGQHEVAISKVEEAVRLNPSDAIARYMLGAVLRRAGRVEEAIPHFDHAMRLSPRDIWLTGMLTDRAFALFALERYEEALEWARRARLRSNPRTMTYAVFAAVLSKLGRLDEARAAVQDLCVHAPGISCTKYRENLFGTPDVMARLTDALRDAGMPE